MRLDVAAFLLQLPTARVVAALLSGSCFLCQAFSYSAGVPVYLLMPCLQTWRAGREPARLGPRWVWTAVFGAAQLQDCVSTWRMEQRGITLRGVSLHWIPESWMQRETEHWKMPGSKSCWHWARLINGVLLLQQEISLKLFSLGLLPGTAEEVSEELRREGKGAWRRNSFVTVTTDQEKPLSRVLQIHFLQTKAQ